MPTRGEGMEVPCRYASGVKRMAGRELRMPVAPRSSARGIAASHKRTQAEEASLRTEAPAGAGQLDQGRGRGGPRPVPGAGRLERRHHFGMAERIQQPERSAEIGREADPEDRAYVAVTRRADRSE